MPFFLFQHVMIHVRFARALSVSRGKLKQTKKKNKHPRENETVSQVRITIVVASPFLPPRPALLASGHAGNADSPRQVGPRYREADRGGTGKEVRFRGGVLRGQSHVVAKAQAQDLVDVR